MLTIVGGTYREICEEPVWNELYGSGFRAAVALAGHIPDISFTTCVGTQDVADLQVVCDIYNIKLEAELIEDTVTFEYRHPLARPKWYSYELEKPARRALPEVVADNILLFDLIEASAIVHGKRVVYDPQSGAPVSFRSTGSTAKQLALVLNSREARSLFGQMDAEDLEHVGRSLLKSEGAEVVIIKNGAQGALVIEPDGIQSIPVFETRSVFPIGSGDIFSAVFAWQWLYEQKSATEAALLASRLTAQYCQFKYLPLPTTPDEDFPALISSSEAKKVYLAGPFFTQAERWMITECRSKLLDFGNQVFSPYHDIGIGPAEYVVPKDIAAIEWCDVVFAVLDGFDPGTVFEVGYAKALGKKVVGLVANNRTHDLTMFMGTNCEITRDFTTAVYKTSW
ncbi:nucleoside 2-deoxyribosyltransferase [Hymenobacter sp. NBH84]|uniref:PfkB family carbohydrate kinase n=1 Tax=Hymenobacter sp. NBH84 TaxID=2596915 RepID=UPI0016269B10|nr:PfkB family carbohydrate kinase [Hymenobacter sp. NBH84]QNE38585.1 nucleoside 2-deoxyribosyltransferase [Hymenobacter sp. NBH84]